MSENLQNQEQNSAPNYKDKSQELVSVHFGTNAVHTDLENQKVSVDEAVQLKIVQDEDILNNYKQPRDEYEDSELESPEYKLKQIKQKQNNPAQGTQQEQATKAQSGNEDTYRFDNMDYKQNQNFFSCMFFFNLLTMALKLKKVFNKKIPLKLHHLPRLNEDDKVKANTEIYYSKLETMVQNNQPILPGQAFKILMRCYKSDIIIIFVVSMMDICLKLFNSISLNYCIQAMIESRTGDAYRWAAGLISSLFLSSVFRHNSWTTGQNLNAKFRLVLVNTIYKKINRLSSHSIREANLGKVINLVSSDLNSTEAKFFFLFQLALAPFTLTLGCIILAFRLGPLGLISVLLLLFIFPVQQIFGRLVSKHIQARTQKSDERIKLINEAIDGIRLIKMYGWEEAFRRMVEGIRNQEIGSNVKGQTLQYIEKSISTTCVLIIAAITFIIIHYEGSYSLNSAKIFSTIEMLQYMKINVMMFSGMGIGYIYELKIFMKRFIDIFSIKEGDMIGNQDFLMKYNKITNEEIIKFDKFNAFWKVKKNNLAQSPIVKTSQKLKSVNQLPITTTQGDEDDKLNLKTEQDKQVQEIQPTLKNFSLSIKKGELLGVVGKIGSGKTTLLNCLLKEIPYYEGYFETQFETNSGKQEIAYVEQEPYIFSNTVRENILFGKPFDEQWYKKVVKNCCLLPDFREMEKGDQTEIGEKGVNISGGQKARICLARAVYSDAQVYLLDDPLSAVDSKVAKKLFKNCIQGILKDKTVILVTHQIHFTKNCDKIVILEEGAIKNTGHFEEMEEDLKKLAAGVLKFENQQEQSENETNSHAPSHGNKEQQNKDDKAKQPENKLKSRNSGEEVTVSLSTYSRYFKIVSSVIFGFPLWLLIFLVMAECAFTAFNRGLGVYDSTSDDSKKNLFGFWIGISFLYLFMNAIKYIFFAYGAQQGNRIIHNTMFKSLSRAPVLFFDQTPGGYLMNKFSNDISIIDNILHYSATDATDIMANFLNLLITCCVINPYIVIPGIVELILLYYFLIAFKDVIIKSKQIDLFHKTPVFQFFQSTLQGIVPIKIYNQRQTFANKMELLCNDSVRTSMTYWLCGRFFGVFVQYITIIASGVGIFIIISLSNSNPGLAGQSLTYFVLMTDSIQWCLRQILNVDSVMSSCERAYKLMDQPSEAPIVTEYDLQNNFQHKDEHDNKKQQQQLKNWPTDGQLAFNNVVMKYSKDLNPVLKGVNFEITPGQKVGCIGRTGAGKSSILQALFRMTESESGSLITYDGQDISKLGLHTLRQKISIIPQVPFVFAGTIRRNIDPLNQHTDEQVWESLRLVELDSYVKKNCPNGINTDMSDVASVFSVGQKQLICLARAVLKNNKLLVLDEATANVDMETDNLIQKTIRTKFQSSSVLTIAHRLNTIADYDKIIVMDDGKVAECDEPFKLLAYSVNDDSITRNTVFAQMVLHTGKNNSVNIFHQAKQKYMDTHSDF